MKQIEITYPDTLDAYRENLKTILLLASSKNNEELQNSLKGIRQAIVEEHTKIDDWMEYLQSLLVHIECQSTWAAVMIEGKEELSSELSADMMMVRMSIMQKICDVLAAKEKVMRLERICSFPHCCPDTFGDNQE